MLASASVFGTGPADCLFAGNAEATSRSSRYRDNAATERKQPRRGDSNCGRMRVLLPFQTSRLGATDCGRADRMPECSIASRQAPAALSAKEARRVAPTVACGAGLTVAQLSRFRRKGQRRGADAASRRLGSQERGLFFAQPGAGLFTHPGLVIGGPFPLEWVTPAPGPSADDWPWPVESPGPFPEVPDDAPEVP
jgi:hypothetical protein